MGRLVTLFLLLAKVRVVRILNGETSYINLLILLLMINLTSLLVVG